VIPHVPFWYWWIAAVMLSIAEILLPSTFFIWFALASAATGILALVAPGLSGELQLLLFAALSVGSWVFGRRFVRRHLAASDEPNLNRRGEQYIGQCFALTEPILGGRGSTKIGDSVRMVEGDEDLDTGTLITVVGVQGIRLKVERAS
jgi:inner membrane protein